MMSLLLVAAAVSGLTGDSTDAIIIAVIVALSVGLGFVNEYRAALAVQQLHERIRRQAVVWRDGHQQNVDVTQLVPGDVVALRIGDIGRARAADAACAPGYRLERRTRGMMAGETSMRILMVAPPGAGKGTQGALIAAHFNIPHIATGDLLRDHVARQTALGQSVQAYLDRGGLVPDEIVLGMVREAMIAAKAAGGGYVLDGIPRNMEQARAAYEIGSELGMTADVALHLQADDAELTRRLLARAALEHRSDDTAEVIAQRLALYHDVTSPILAWYRDRGILVSVDAMRSADEVGREILVALEAMRPVLEHVPAQDRLAMDLTGLGEAFGAAGSAASAPE